MATRGVSCGWKKMRPLTLSGCAKASRLVMRPAPTRRPYAAQRVGGGSVTPTPRMSSGIRACCRLVMRAVRHSQSRHYARLICIRRRLICRIQQSFQTLTEHAHAFRFWEHGILNIDGETRNYVRPSVDVRDGRHENVIQRSPHLLASPPAFEL
jgi:hypothetical protein